jgi:glycosyltransferase involved in cell wall biosynthesis
MKKSICLNMIVKDEILVIERCLSSVIRLIDYWVIVDTGSTDGTQEKIKNYLQNIPGELHEKKWMNFGYNRNEAMRLAQDKGDYLLFIDADDFLSFSEGFSLPELQDDIYSIKQIDYGNDTYAQHNLLSIVKNNGSFTWTDKVHEYLELAETFNKVPVITLLENVFNNYVCDGCRSKDTNKLSRDVNTLKEMVDEEPYNYRAVFYLARTCYAKQDFKEAIKWFDKRSKMLGDPMEIYFSLLYIALSERFLGLNFEQYIGSFFKAHIYRPSRSEAIYEAAKSYFNKNEYFISYALSKIAASIPMTKDTLFIEPWVYEWGSELNLFACAHNLGLKEEAFELINKLRNIKNIPKQVAESYGLDSLFEYYNSLFYNGAEKCKTL